MWRVSTSRTSTSSSCSTAWGFSPALLRRRHVGRRGGMRDAGACCDGGGQGQSGRGRLLPGAQPRQAVSAGARPLQGGGRGLKTPTIRHRSVPVSHSFGLVSPAQEMAMIVRRHMHEFGTTTEHFGMVSVAQRAHAARNPHAVMRGADHVGGPPGVALDRRAAAPARLLAGDGRPCAVIITSAERAGDCRQPPPHPRRCAGGGPITSRWPTTRRMGSRTCGQSYVAQQLDAMVGVQAQEHRRGDVLYHFGRRGRRTLEDGMAS